MEDLINTIERYVHLNNSDVEWINSHFEIKIIPKNGCLLKPGLICNSFAFVRNGLIRHSIFDENGVEKTIYFSAENDFVCDYESFYGRQASIKQIAAIEETTIIAISYSNMQLFYSQISAGERFGRLLSEEVFNNVLRHVVAMHTNSAEELYLNFIRAYSHIQQRIPLYFIASFVGVTPQSLSRIRRSIAKK